MPVAPSVSPKLPPTAPSMQDKLYTTAKGLLGSHLTLDPSVPNEVNCAETVSAILKQTGIPVPLKGFAGTTALYAWLLTNPDFESSHEPEAGMVVISPTGYSSNKDFPHGHTGIVLQHGIASNDSTNGRFNENYSQAAWVHHFTEVAGYPTYYFRPRS